MAKFVKDAICNYLEGTKIMTKMRNKLRVERRMLGKYSPSSSIYSKN
jgi:hypothetical protein